jgi:glycosyltransferase involved in cell wall biosynthesis
MIVHRCPDARLLILGAGPLEAELRGHLEAAAGADSEGLAATVTFAGFRPDLREFLGRVDLVVHPAAREGLGVSLLEAQAAGVPVVACAAGGIPEAVADGDTGLLVEPGSPTALAEAVILLLNDAEWRQRLGTAGAARMRAEFSPGRMAEAYIRLYREVLG